MRLISCAIGGEYEKSPEKELQLKKSTVDAARPELSPFHKKEHPDTSHFSLSKKPTTKITSF